MKDFNEKKFSLSETLIKTRRVGRVHSRDDQILSIFQASGRRLRRRDCLLCISAVWKYLSGCPLPGCPIAQPTCFCLKIPGGQFLPSRSPIALPGLPKMQTSISSAVPLGATQVYSGRCLRGEKTYFAQNQKIPRFL